MSSSSSRALVEVDASVAIACNLGEIRGGFLEWMTVEGLREEDVAINERWRGRRAGGKEWERGVVPARKVDRRSMNWSFDAKSISRNRFCLSFDLSLIRWIVTV